MSYDKDHNLSRRFIVFGKQYERNIYGKGLCDLPIATSRLCDKSAEVCVRSCTRNRVLRVDCEAPNYVITSKKEREDKGSMSEVPERYQKDSSEWKLCPLSFSKIGQILGKKPEIDLFASRLSNQLPSYYS